MSRIQSGLDQIGRLDRLAAQDTPIHRLDPRAKVVTTLVFLVCVVSFDKYQVLAMLPFAIFPIALASAGNLPLGYLARKLVVIAPFAVAVGVFNPFLDRAVMVQLGGLGISGGWVSLTSILLRFALTTSAALVLIGTTSFNRVCMALERLGTPDVFATQLLFLYRYIFVLGEEALSMTRARALRSFGGRGMGMRVYASMLGHLLLRTYDRAHRVYLCMLSRGFDGQIRSAGRLHLSVRDVVFTGSWCALFVACRMYNVPLLLGQTVTQVIT